jgi:hypothetical protein
LRSPTCFTVAVDTDLVLLGLRSLLFFESSGLIPLLCDLLLPVLVGLDLFHSVLDDGEGLSNFKIFHELVIIEVVGKLQELVYFCLFVILLLLLGCGPSWLLTLFGGFG